MNFSSVELIEELKQCFIRGDGFLHGVTGNESQRHMHRRVLSTGFIGVKTREGLG